MEQRLATNLRRRIVDRQGRNVLGAVLRKVRAEARGRRRTLTKFDDCDVEATEAEIPTIDADMPPPAARARQPERARPAPVE